MDFDKIIPRKNSDCIKYDLLKERFGEDDLLPFWIADMDFQAPKAITKALHERIDHPLYGYAMVADAFFEAIINYYAKQGIMIREEDILFANGVVPSLIACVKAFSNVGDGILLQNPVYYPFYDVIKFHNDRVLLLNPLSLQDGRYEIDFNDLEQQLKKAQILLLCHPHNPSGRVFTQEELSQIIDLCLQYEVLIVSDEIHSDIIYTPHTFHSILSFDKASGISIVLNAASKSYNIAGFATSYIICYNPSLLRTLRITLNQMFYSVPNLLGTIATTTAYNECQEWLETLLIYLQNSRDMVVDFIHEHIPLLTPIKPEATYLLWIDFNRLDNNHQAIKKRLIYQARLALNSGVDFGGVRYLKEPVGQGFFRFNFAAAQELLQQGLIAMKQEFST